MIEGEGCGAEINGLDCGARRHCRGALAASAANAQSLSLSSPDIKEGGTIANEQVFKGFGRTGGNISPALSWSGAPSGTKSFAVGIYDPDAPTGSGWWHWVVFNIPPGTDVIAQRRR